MIDAQQWVINTVGADLFQIVAGLMILILLIELLDRVREWLQ